MSDAIVVIGAGGHAKVVLATLQALGIEVAGVFDDEQILEGRVISGSVVRGPTREAGKYASVGVLAIGSNEDRARLASELSLEWATVVHPAARIDASVVVGPGSVIFAGATIQPGTVLGEHVIVNTGAVIDHDCNVRSFSHIGPGVSIAGGVSVGEGALMGVGSCAIPGVSVGDRATVGAGAAVVSDLQPGVTAVGVPARVVGGGETG